MALTDYPLTRSLQVHSLTPRNFCLEASIYTTH